MFSVVALPEFGTPVTSGVFPSKVTSFIIATASYFSKMCSDSGIYALLCHQYCLALSARMVHILFYEMEASESSGESTFPASKPSTTSKTKHKLFSLHKSTL
jgi:hypothetical protein